ncbi:hypothetical protein [Paenibacillus protaetiae]|uniref:hypothetical protein n=1 Tax=Paenibacillus protaetiae TaxID=2509456 RepID=UPI0013EE0C41|nr:hypothetical protein [Paenibacillus protaetiae]
MTDNGYGSCLLMPLRLGGRLANFFSFTLEAFSFMLESFCRLCIFSPLLNGIFITSSIIMGFSAANYVNGISPGWTKLR